MNELPIETKELALKLRGEGYSIKEISDKLNIAQSTSSLWVRRVILGESAQKRLNSRKIVGQNKTSLIWKKKKEKECAADKIAAQEVVNKICKDRAHYKIYCSLLYWCEGGKSDKTGLRFTNSDPELIQIFLALLREGFEVNEEKLHILMHLHEYHNEKKQKVFWSEATNIPSCQFYRTYLKLNTAKRVKADYPGCITIYYDDRMLARRVRAIYKTFLKIWVRS